MARPTVKNNIIANFLGKSWVGIANLVVAPIYVKLIGIESYGLLGVFASFLGLLLILDMGLSSMLSRELALLSSNKDSAQESRDLVRTLEYVYWSIGIIVGTTVVALAPYLSRSWLNSQSLPVETIQSAIMLMGISIAFHWPASLYFNGLIGLQRHVLMNGIRSAIVVCQHGGSILVLLVTSNSIIAFFVWQLFIGTVQTLILTWTVWRSLPQTVSPASFQLPLIRKNWHFAAGMTGISILVVLLTQLDKIVLSKLLPLTFFGYYTLTLNLSNIIPQLVSPLFSALFPRFSQMSVEQDEQEFSALYHKACQLASIIILPAAVTMSLFSREILQVWLQNADAAENTYVLLSLLTIGSAINALMTLPYTVQIATGWTRLIFMQNLASVLLLAPLMIIMVKMYSTVGAAIVWLILNSGYLFILVPIMHSKMLRKDMQQWYLIDVGIPLLIVLTISLCSRLTMPANISEIASIVWIAVTASLSVALSFLVLPQLRSILTNVLLRKT